MSPVEEFLGWGFFAMLAGRLVIPSSRFPRLSDFLDVGMDAVYGGLVVYWVVTRAWVNAGAGVAIMVFILWSDNRRGGRRQKSARSLGEKSRALRDALVRRAREVFRPGPVRVPVPVREES